MTSIKQLFSCHTRDISIIKQQWRNFLVAIKAIYLGLYIDLYLIHFYIWTDEKQICDIALINVNISHPSPDVVITYVIKSIIIGL